MQPKCPTPSCESQSFSSAGYFDRKYDGKKVPRYRCKVCGKRFSEATGTPEFGQKKPYLNQIIFQGLVSGLSMRRIALNNNTNRKTVARKLEYLAELYQEVQYDNYDVKKGEEDVKFGEIGCKKVKVAPDDEFQEVQIDDLITTEHTKLKPLSVTVHSQGSAAMDNGF